jgi:hypothetical protein
VDLGSSALILKTSLRSLNTSPASFLPLSSPSSIHLLPLFLAHLIQLLFSSPNAAFNLSDEMINMAERLGIKAISEPQLLWIARDALSVSLPAQWIILKVRGTQNSFLFYFEAYLHRFANLYEERILIPMLRSQLGTEILF